jgi:pimeloyl-ACP methyl ester carboxylesterase
VNHDAKRWPRAYRPLRPRAVAAQLAILVLVEVALYASYASHEARFHWATHFLVGLLATSLWQSLHLLVAARPARGQLVTIVLFHLWAMWPDLLFRAGVPHHRWMDGLALGHVSSHYLPGGDTSWLVLALLGTAGYLFLLWRWLVARHTEAAAGLPPALGVGGGGVLRAQSDPRLRQLAHEHLLAGAPHRSQDPLVLLHGLGATAATWLPTGRLLAEAGFEVVVPDLLGFGSSLRLGTRFRLDDQADAVVRLLDHHDIARAHLVGHSWGCTVAGAVACRAPQRVARLTLVEPAVFADPQAARERFGKRSRLARLTVADADIGGIVCGVICLLRPVFSRIAPYVEADVPAPVARGGVQHSYPAYRDALNSMWQDNPLPGLLRSPVHPTTVVLADGDETVHLRDVLDLPPSDSVDIVRVPGTHALPYAEPAATADLVLASAQTAAVGGDGASDLSPR